MSGLSRINNRFPPDTEQRLTVAAKAGATVGWTVNTTADTSFQLLPASQNNSTLILPLNRILDVGDLLLGYQLIGDITSGGNTVTLDCTLYEQKFASSGQTTAAVPGSVMTQISKTAATLLTSSNALVTIPDFQRYTVQADRSLFALVKGTTGSGATIEFGGIVLLVKALQ